MANMPWQLLSIQDFLAQVNWNNSSLLDPTERSLSSEHGLPWQKETVEFFFKNCPWSEAAQKAQYGTTVSKPFSLSLSVEDYFRCFAWSTPVVIEKKNKKSRSSSVHEQLEPSLSLNDLSNLF